MSNSKNVTAVMPQNKQEVNSKNAASVLKYLTVVMNVKNNTGRFTNKNVPNPSGHHDQHSRFLGGPKHKQQIF